MLHKMSPKPQKNYQKYPKHVPQVSPTCPQNFPPTSQQLTKHVPKMFQNMHCSQFSPLDEGFEYFRPQKQILRNKLPLQMIQAPGIEDLDQ